MSYLYQSDEWFDGSWWQVSVPDNWKVRVLETHLFEGAGDCLLSLGIGKTGPNCSMSGYGHLPLPDENMLEPGKSVYLQTRQQADMTVGLRSPLERHELGVLTGYLYRQEVKRRISWKGFFAFEEWRIYAVIYSATSRGEEGKTAAAGIMSSMLFSPNHKLNRTRKDIECG